VGDVGGAATVDLQAGEGQGFGAGQATQAPIGDSDALDEEALEEADGLNLVEEGGVEGASERRSKAVRAGSSCHRVKGWVSMPWVTALRAERRLPAGVRGPVERWALRRLAAMRASEVGMVGLLVCRGYGYRRRWWSVDIG
jgi:hypothetical protein